MYVGISRENVIAAIITLQKNVKENMLLISAQIGNPIREI